MNFWMAPVGLRQDGAGYPARQTKLSDYRVIIPLSLSLSSPIFRLSNVFDRFKTFLPTLVRYRPFSPSFISSMYYFFNVLFHQACIVIRFVVYFGSRGMTTARWIFSSLRPTVRPFVRKLQFAKNLIITRKFSPRYFRPKNEREEHTSAKILRRNDSKNETILFQLLGKERREKDRGAINCEYFRKRNFRSDNNFPPLKRNFACANNK